MVKDHFDNEKGNLLLPHTLLFPINSKGSFICTIPDRIAHTMAFVTPVVEHWLEREIAQWVHPMKDRSNDRSHHERTYRSYSINKLACVTYLVEVIFQRFLLHFHLLRQIGTGFPRCSDFVLCVFAQEDPLVEVAHAQHILLVPVVHHFTGIVKTHCINACTKNSIN